MASPNHPLRHASALAPEQTITLDGAHVRALHAREVAVKEAFTIVDRDGGFFRASLEAMSANAGRALVYERMGASTESPAKITLVCAVLARQRMLGVIQKATELGAMRIVPVISERSVPREGLAHEKAHSWPRQAVRATRQCRRASLPEVLEATPLADIYAQSWMREADLRVYLDDRTAQESALAATDRDGLMRIVLAVGPEGGWTDDERGSLEAHGAHPLRLGGRVLRAETAVLVGLTLLQHAYGDM